MRKFNWFLIFLLWILIGGIIMKFWPTNLVDKINQYAMMPEDNSVDYYQDKYERFEMVDHVLNDWYYNYENIDQKHMMQEALKSYVDGIEDPYTVYMDADQNSGFVWSLEWEEEFEGIWAVVTKKDYYVLIEEILKWSPAFNAWIKALDRVVKIDSGYVENESLDESVTRMRWPTWTKVNITIERYSTKMNSWSLVEETNWKEIIEIEVTREKISVPSVTSEIIEISDKWNTDELKKIWYIEMFIIWEETENLFKHEIKSLKAAWVEWIILDLRWNGGGLMPIAVEISSHFIEKWKLIVSAKYKWYEDESYYSKWFWEFEDMDIVVLIDWMTASAWEIIAMALHEQAWAKLVWTTTFGKWTIQTLDEFSDGDSLKYTIWKWFPPSEKNIDKVGVDPDVIVEFDIENYIDSDYDNQLEEAKSMLK